jgi:amidohydrolase
MTAFLAAMALVAQAAPAQVERDRVAAAATAIQPKVVAWRRDIHEHPELSNQEARTAALVAAHLRRLGYEVRTGVARHGVVGVLKGARPGKVVALRADMDALPVAEQTGLPFASKATATFAGRNVPVMHACGHDAHVAMLMGAAEILAGMKDRIAGTVVLVFQPAEEGPPVGEKGGAPLMVAERALAAPKPDAIFGLHVFPGEVGSLVWRSGPFMAGSDTWEMTVTGRQTHGAMPWNGVDAASVSASIVQAFNQIAARQLNVAHAPTVLTVGEIRLGTRHNIIPGTFEMTGTLRTFDPAMRTDVMARIDGALKAIGAQYGAGIALRWVGRNAVTANDPALARAMEPTLARAAGAGVRGDADYVMGAEDFSAFAAVAPTMFYHLGIGADAAPNHSPQFTVDEAALPVGVRAHVLTALDFLNGAGAAPAQAK